MTIAIRLTVLLIFLIYACNSDTAKNKREGTITEVKTLTPGPISIQQAKALHEGGNAIFVDLRTPEEIEEYGKIEGAIEMNIRDADFKKRFQNLDGRYPIVFYCQAGSRSETVYLMSKKLGFSRTYDMTEGYEGWQNYKGD